MTVDFGPPIGMPLGDEWADLQRRIASALVVLTAQTDGSVHLICHDAVDVESAIKVLRDMADALEKEGAE